MPLLMNLLSSPALWKALAIVALAAALFIGGCRQGEANIQADWDKSKLDSAKALEDLKKEQEAATNALITDYDQLIANIQKNTKVITKKVKVYVPADSCPLPPGFRVLHDAAVRNELPHSPSNPDEASSTVDPIHR